ncbi:MAG: Hsp20/alpha crystallin family protein [Planctomycetota bacterium]|nr:Hsp20/alpha crystallin family protein [Planctomycetota bacterium]
MANDKPVKVEATRSERDLSAEAFAPLSDSYETDEELVLVAEMPGAALEDISVRVDKGVLTIEGDAKFDVPDEDYARTYVSFCPGQYFRAFALSDEIDRDKITASIADGILTVRLPKAEAAQSRKIEIKVAD